MYVIDLGYRRRKLRFATLDEARKTANKIFASTGIVVAITELKTRTSGARAA
jgi:hypothetical protein